MAKFDYGGGCPCGLYRECPPGCINAPIKIIEKVYIKEEKVMSKENDFGFTFVDEGTFTKVEKVVDDEKLKKLRGMIMPLLLNLKKNPEKDIIQWPGAERVKSVDAFIKKMDNLLDESKD